MNLNQHYNYQLNSLYNLVLYILKFGINYIFAYNPLNIFPKYHLIYRC